MLFKRHSIVGITHCNKTQEKAMTSSSIDVALTVTEFGRKCRSNSGMCSSSHVLAVHQSSDCARTTEFRQSTSCGSKQVMLRSGCESVTSQRHRSCWLLCDPQRVGVGVVAQSGDPVSPGCRSGRHGEIYNGMEKSAVSRKTSIHTPSAASSVPRPPITRAGVHTSPSLTVLHLPTYLPAALQVLQVPLLLVLLRS